MKIEFSRYQKSLTSCNLSVPLFQKNYLKGQHCHDQQGMELERYKGQYRHDQHGMESECLF